MLIGETELRRLLNEVDHLRKQRDELQAANNSEVERRREAVADAARAWERVAELEKAASMACENPCNDCGGCNTAKELRAS